MSAAANRATTNRARLLHKHLPQAAGALPVTAHGTSHPLNDTPAITLFDGKNPLTLLTMGAFRGGEALAVLRKSGAFGIILAGSIMLNACVGVTDPLLRAEYLEPAEPGPRTAISYETALGHADALRAEYREAVRNQGRLQTYTGLGLITLGIAAIGLGASEASGDELLYTALGASHLYSSSAFLTSNPRQRAYMASYNAVSCVVEITRPIGDLRTSHGYEHVAALVGGASRDGTSIGGSIAATRSELNLFRANLAAASSQGHVPTALSAEFNAAIGRVVADLERAEAARANAADKISVVNNIGATLDSGLREVLGQSDSAILSTIPAGTSAINSLSTLTDLYSSFTGLSSSLVVEPVPTPTANPVAQQSRAERQSQTSIAQLGTLMGQFRALNAAHRTLIADLSDVATFIANYESAKPDLVFDTCGIDTSEIVTALRLSTASITATQGTAVTNDVIVSGGVPPYGLSQGGVSETHSGVTAAFPMYGATVLRVSIPDDAPPGVLPFTIVDSSLENRVTLTVTVNRSETVTGNRANDQSQDTSLRGRVQAAFERFTEAERKTIQRAICLRQEEQDGRFGAITYGQLDRSLADLSAANATTQMRALIDAPDRLADTCELQRTADLASLGRTSGEEFAVIDSARLRVDEASVAGGRLSLTVEPGENWPDANSGDQSVQAQWRALTDDAIIEAFLKFRSVTHADGAPPPGPTIDPTLITLIKEPGVMPPNP